MKDRGIRRHHIERLKRKRSHYHGGITDPKDIGIVCATPQLCSCLCCGNRRRYEGETKQELLSEIEMHEQLETMV